MNTPAIAKEIPTPRYVVPAVVFLMLALAAGSLVAADPLNASDPAAYTFAIGG
jgi:hypothetical protein